MPQVCEMTGFEFKRDEVCREVSEPECQMVNVTKFRTQIGKNNVDL